MLTRDDLSVSAMANNKQRSRDSAPQPSPMQPEPPVSVRHFNQIDLARRWRISPRTLERWRWLKQGPAYLKVGNHVVYRTEDIEAYEAAKRRESAAV